MEEQVKITGVYRHFSGNYYFVENVGFDSESKERLVIYIYPRKVKYLLMVNLLQYYMVLMIIACTLKLGLMSLNYYMIMVLLF